MGQDKSIDRTIRFDCAKRQIAFHDDHGRLIEVRFPGRRTGVLDTFRLCCAVGTAQQEGAGGHLEGLQAQVVNVHDDAVMEHGGEGGVVGAVLAEEPEFQSKGTAKYVLKSAPR